jgi:hypothetical protein
VDEDNLDDLNGDGHITQMRRRNVNGRFRVSPEDPRLMVPVRPGERGEYDLLGQEGFDNDGDGFVNEDADGGYDPNRNWPWRWAPQYVQGGSDPYPTSLVETQHIIRFVTAHPNIAGAQSYHNSGGHAAARPRRPAGRVPSAGRAGVRRDRAHRRGDPPGLSLHDRLEGPLHGVGRRARLVLRRARNPDVQQRAVHAVPLLQPDQRRRRRAVRSATRAATRPPSRASIACC